MIKVTQYIDEFIPIKSSVLFFEFLGFEDNSSSYLKSGSNEIILMLSNQENNDI